MSAPLALDPEWSILLAAVSAGSASGKEPHLHALLRGPFSCERLFSMAERHGLQPLLYERLSRVEHLVPAEQLQILQRASQTNLHKALLLSRELIRIVAYLSELGIEAMPYKGLALAESLYGDIALRQAGDIDLLIRPADLPQVLEAAARLGYITHTQFSGLRANAYLRSGYEYAFDSAAGRNLLEVQWALQPRFYAVDFDMDEIFGRAMRIDVAGHPMKTPSREDLVLTLSVHAAKHVWGRLIWLCDIARLAAQPGLDWNWIGGEARRLGVARIVQVTLRLAGRLLQADIPTAAKGTFSGDSEAAALAQEIEIQIAVGEFNVESFSYFRLMMRLRENPSDRMRFLSRLLFTPGPGEWQAIQLPRSLFPLYRLVRLSRLAARLVAG